MSTADRFHASGRKAPRKRPVNWRKQQDRYIEARKGGADIRRKMWVDHLYDCDNGFWGSGRKLRHKQMESCSLYASHSRLWGETPSGKKVWEERRFSYAITDGHW
jgi:hypothetical protein